MIMAQEAHWVEVEVADALNYLLALPKGYGDDPARKWPLILFLHGAGERGEDLELVKKHGIPKLAEGGDLPFIAVSPQCPCETWWSDHIPALLALLDDVAARYAVDERRVYLTGLSMGGYGSWHLGAKHPERFAAVAPICGGGSWHAGFPAKVQALKGTPVWVFHGAKDPTVPLRESQVLVDKLTECGGNVRFTVYPEAGHDSWTAAYNDPALYEWLLEQHK